jgi:hypothetical protein
LNCLFVVLVLVLLMPVSAKATQPLYLTAHSIEQLHAAAAFAVVFLHAHSKGSAAVGVYCNSVVAVSG